MQIINFIIIILPVAFWLPFFHLVILKVLVVCLIWWGRFSKPATVDDNDDDSLIIDASLQISATHWTFVRQINFEVLTGKC